MKKAGSKILTLFLLQCFTFFILNAQQEYKKNSEKIFDINSQTKLDFSNKYGKVDIKNWDKNKIEIKSEIIVRISSQEKADKILKGIAVHYDIDGDNISVKTEFDENVMKLLGNNSKLSNGKIEVNHNVMMPSTVPLNLFNKYGSVFIDQLVSNSTIEVKYGKLVANKITSAEKKPVTEIILSYSSGNIEECQWVKLNLKYAKIHVVNSKALAGITKYSKVYVDNGSSLVTESKYDTYKIGTLNNFATDASYTNIKFDKINTKIDAVLKYSELKVDKISNSFEEIDIDNKYGSCMLIIDSNASYQLEGTAGYGAIIYPSDSKVSISNNSYTESKYSGYVGTKGSSKTVNINTKYGTVKLTE